MMERINSHLCMTSDIGMSGNLFGGKLMAWMDEAAAIYAMKITSEKYVVTRRFSECLFTHPIHLGELAEIYCGNHKRGRTSVSFSIDVRVDDESRFQAECTFVAVDEHGNKKRNP